MHHLSAPGGAWGSDLARSSVREGGSGVSHGVSRNDEKWCRSARRKRRTKRACEASATDGPGILVLFMSLARGACSRELEHASVRALISSVLWVVVGIRPVADILPSQQPRAPSLHVQVVHQAMRRHVRAEGAQVWALLQRGRRRRRVGAVRASGEAEGTRMPHADRDVVLNRTCTRLQEGKETHTLAQVARKRKRDADRL